MKTNNKTKDKKGSNIIKSNNDINNNINNDSGEEYINILKNNIVKLEEENNELKRENRKLKKQLEEANKKIKELEEKEKPQIGLIPLIIRIIIK